MSISESKRLRMKKRSRRKLIAKVDPKSLYLMDSYWREAVSRYIEDGVILDSLPDFIRKPIEKGSNHE